MQQKEETFKVAIDVIKNSTCFKAFTITAEVPEIFMQQFWYTIKKVKDSETYEFLLANKKCIVDAEVFRKILDICPRVEGEEFTEVQDDDATLTFLIELGYKGLLHMYTNMYVDHMHHPWRTLAAIINKYLSRKTTSNDRLRKSKIDIIFFIGRRENQDVKLFHSPDLPKSSSITSFLNKRVSPTLSFSTIIQSRMMKSRGKGSQGKTTADTPVADVDVSEESDFEPAKKRTASRRVVKKKVIIFAADNIIPDPDVALELGKSISLTEAAEEEAVRQVYVTHARIVTESEPEPAKKKTSSRSTRGVVFQETPSAPKPKPATSKLKLKGVQSLTPKEQEAADIMQALKERKKTSRRQPGTEGSNKGTGVSPGVLDESTVVLATSSEGTGTKPGVLDEEKVTSEEKFILKWGSKQESEYLEEDQGYVEEVDWIDSDEDEEKKDDTDDDKSIDLEMTDDKETDDDGDEENTDAAKADAKKIEEIKDDAQKAELPPTSSSLSLRTPQMLRSTNYWILKSNLKFHKSTPILTPPITIDAPTITTTVPESNALSVVQLRVAKLEKDVFELKNIDHSAKALADLKSKVLTVVEQDCQDQKEQAEKQKMPKYTIKSTDKATLKEYDLQSALYETMHENKSFNKNPAYHAVYHALMEALIEDENAMDKGVSDTVKNHKRQHDDDDHEDPSAGPNQGKKTKRRRTKELESSKKPSTTKETPKGKAPSKGSKTGKSRSAKEPVEKPIAEVVMDDAFNTASEDVVCDDDQPQDTLEPKTNKTLNQDWFNQPPRPPTLDPKWNKHKLDWNNPERDPYPFNLSKPLPLQSRPGHLTVVVDYFFNNDLEYLKTSDPEKTYTTSITKTKAARYDFVGIEDMVPMLWSTIKHAYDKDAAKGIKHWGKKRNHWYRSQMKKISKHNVYSTQNILGVKSVSVKKLHRYGHLEEVVLFHLNDSDIVDFILALRMFTRSLIIKCRVEDLQLGVESYQKKLNITAPQQTFPEIGFKELYTPSYKPPRVIYEDLTKQNRVMRADELYKFSDGTLKKVLDELHHKILDFHLG
ncbi:hypothetical protein Tco_1102865 [Tanacetum coccineum]